MIEPYFISVCLLKSSAFSMGVCMRCTVKNAARLAVYDEIRIRVKKDHTQLTNLTDGARGFMSVPFRFSLAAVGFAVVVVVVIVVFNETKLSHFG